jgi:uncharacterized protein (UPF0335 family)
MPESAGDAHKRLRSLVERIEALEQEKQELSKEIRDTFQEAKSAGFDVPAMRQVLKCRKMKQEEYWAQEHLIGTYLSALGVSTPRHE